MSPKKNKISVTMLSSGLKLAYCQWPGAAVEYCGAVIKVGSRDDGPQSSGLAHFVEHTIFKGTARRSSWHIINRMERVGGELNAYTSKEETVVYTAAPAGNLARAMELIADLITSSRFPASELDKERDVVADEINSYLDTPAEAVYDDFEDLLFAGNPLGRNILGNVEALASFTSEECQRYLQKWYTAGNMAVFYCGPVSFDRVLKTVEANFSALSQADSEAHRQHCELMTQEPFDVVRKIGIHQAHTVMGCRIEGMHGKNKRAMALLINILGGPGMNSLLNVALREKRGLVYSVEASSTLLTDIGVFTVYFGCDSEDTDKCKRLVKEQISRIADGSISPTALASAKKQYLGQLAVASDNRESSAIGAGRAALYFGEILTRQQVEALVNAVTPADIVAAANTLSSLSALTLC